MKFLITYINLLSLIIPSEYSTNKSSNFKKCSKYSELEQEIHCGNDGYLIMYGQKYCQIFNSHENIEKFDGIGKEWLNCTTDCLLKSITQITHEEEKKTPPDCMELYHQAFKSHVKCYLDCNFCNVCKTNKAALLNAYDFKDFWSREAVEQVYEVLKDCGPFTCFY